MKIKSKVIQKLLESNLVKPYDVIEHSYTAGKSLQQLIVSTNGILPCITTRPDTLGVVIINEKTK